MIVSFGVQEGAENWLKETNCQFPMFLDHDRSLYQAFGLHRSLSKVFNYGTLQFYGEQVALNRDLPKAMKGIEDDPLQMGGDFIINRTRKEMALVYRSKNPEDRPSIQEIVENLN